MTARSTERLVVIIIAASSGDTIVAVAGPPPCAGHLVMVIVDRFSLDLDLLYDEDLAAGKLGDDRPEYGNGGAEYAELDLQTG